MMHLKCNHIKLLITLIIHYIQRLLVYIDYVSIRDNFVYDNLLLLVIILGKRVIPYFLKVILHKLCTLR